MQDFPFTLIETINALKLPVSVISKRSDITEYNSYTLPIESKDRIIQAIKNAGIEYSKIRILGPGSITLDNYMSARLTIYFYVDSDNHLVVRKTTWG